MAKAKQFPDRLYVYREEDGKEHYFVAGEGLEGIAEDGETRAVAVYKLVEAGEVSTSVQYKRRF